MRYGPVNKNLSALLLFLLGTTAVPLGSWPVLAQDAADTIALDTISVAGLSRQAETAYGPVVGYRATRSATGTKTDTTLRDLPQTVNVVPREVLVDRQETRLADGIRRAVADRRVDLQLRQQPLVLGHERSGDHERSDAMADSHPCRR